MNKTIVVLGGGIGGVVTARELRRHLGMRHRILVVDKNPYHDFPPSFPWLLIGWRVPEALRKPLSLLEKYAIEVKRGSVEEIDVSREVVVVGNETIPYDYLVIAMGGVSSPSAIPGWGDGCYSLASAENAAALGSRLAATEQERIAIVNADESGLYPPLAYETAFLLESYLSRKGRRGMRIDLFSPEPSPLQLFQEVTSSAIDRLLHERSIRFHAGKKLSGIRENGRKIFFEDGSSAECDLLLCIPPLHPPEAIAQAGLRDSSGWLPVDRATLQMRAPRCFAVGDVACVTSPEGVVLPKLGAYAASQAEVVAGAIAHELGAHVTVKKFDGIGYCFIETGNGRAAYVSASYFTTPSPVISYHEPNVTYHWGKVVFEKYWMWRWL